MKQINLRVDDELYAEIERRRGATKREPFLRDILQSYLAGEMVTTQQRPGRWQTVTGPDVSRLRSSSQAKRDVVPVPKTGKR